MKKFLSHIYYLFYYVFKYPKAFVEYSNKNLKEYNPSKMCNVLMVFDNIIADMISNKKIRPIVTELFVSGKKLNICTVFIT